MIQKPNTSTAWDTINIQAGHPDFTLKAGIGNVVRYHGKDIDLRSCPRLVADKIAADPNIRWLSFSQAQKAQEVTAAVGKKK